MKLIFDISALSGVARKADVTNVNFNFVDNTPKIQLDVKIRHFVDGVEITKLEYPARVIATDDIGTNTTTLKRVTEKVLNPNAVDLGADPDFEANPDLRLYQGSYYNVPEGEELMVWPDGVEPNATFILSMISNTNFDITTLIAMFIANADERGDFNV